MYHAPQAVAAQPSRHARLFELFRQQNIAAMKASEPVAEPKPAPEVTQFVPKPKQQPSQNVDADEAITSRLLKSATASLRRAS